MKPGELGVHRHAVPFGQAAIPMSGLVGWTPVAPGHVEPQPDLLDRGRLARLTQPPVVSFQHGTSWTCDERVWHAGQAASGAVVATAIRTNSVPTDREVMVSPTGATHGEIIMTDACIHSRSARTGHYNGDRESIPQKCHISAGVYSFPGPRWEWEATQAQFGPSPSQRETNFVGRRPIPVHTVPTHSQFLREGIHLPFPRHPQRHAAKFSRRSAAVRISCSVRPGHRAEWISSASSSRCHARRLPINSHPRRGRCDREPRCLAGSFWCAAGAQVARPDSDQSMSDAVRSEVRWVGGGRAGGVVRVLLEAVAILGLLGFELDYPLSLSMEQPHYSWWWADQMPRQ